MAEIIAAISLGLDLSTLASIANGTFALSHEKLGRNRPDHGLKDFHIDENFFGQILKELGDVVSWSQFDVSNFIIAIDYLFI